ncbi:MAG: hypothetical protein WC335_09590 [Candidatus Omnitrophota bacterium]|jgi:hypothetical protein
MKKKPAKILVFVYCAAMFSGGCSFIGRSQEILFLKQMADNQSGIERYVQKQERGFDILRGDIEYNLLQKGTAKEEIVSRYGDPVYCSDSADTPDCRQMCLYRYPTRFFSSDKIYLYFDRGQDLCRWEFDFVPKPKTPSFPSGRR